ncbi:HupE/UreJ family protein [Pseudoalteromonas sp. SSDWG2]|uniref:HupE/UreJ family protein n=1 Tax=Pseudoalteromonas sp. SSDWG2 TaxID=3139391 RepID=UPI003BAB94C6
MRIINVVLLLLLSLCANAHDARPIVVQINEQGQHVSVNVKAPASMTLAGFPEVLIDAGCQIQHQGGLQRYAGEFRSTYISRCAQPIAGAKVTLQFPEANPSLSTLIKVSLQSTEQYSQLLSPDEQSWTIPKQEQALHIATSYIQMGMMHIWMGWDHLLFVLCLLLIANSNKRLIYTITGFTIGHSITLIATVMHWVSMPIAIAEILIALSLLFLAVEIAKQQHDSWTYRYPVIIAALFGLLHGFGFASVLSEIGLPQLHLASALVAFNIGIELGQIAFVLVALAIIKMVPKHAPSFVPRKQGINPFVYIIGGLSAFWFLQRSTDLFIGGLTL